MKNYEKTNLWTKASVKINESPNFLKPKFLQAIGGQIIWC